MPDRRKGDDEGFDNHGGGVGGPLGGFGWPPQPPPERGTLALVEQLRADGWQVDYADLGVAGFPNRIDTTVTGLTLADASGQNGWAAPEVQVYMR